MHVIIFLYIRFYHVYFVVLAFVSVHDYLIIAVVSCHRCVYTTYKKLLHMWQLNLLSFKLECLCLLIMTDGLVNLSGCGLV